MSTATSAPTRLKGRVLTRHAIHRHGALVLQYFLATESGPVLVEVERVEHLSFCHQTDSARLLAGVGRSDVRSQPLALKSFAHQSVSGLYARTAQAHRQVIRVAKDTDVPLFEADIKAESRFLIERFIALDAEFQGVMAPAQTARQHEAEPSAGLRAGLGAEIPLFKAQRARRTELSQGLKLISLDFECSAEGELYSVGLYGKDYQKVIMVGAEQAHSAAYLEWVADEAALIQRLIHWFADYDPDVIIGWAVVTFDLALLSRRAGLHGIELTLGRAATPLGWKIEGKYRPETLSLPGRVVLDGIDWLKAAFYRFDSFSLENVAQALLGEGKAIHDVDNRLEEIALLFRQDKPALAHYNLNDSRLVWDIFAKTQLLDFAIERARLTGLEFGRVGASVAAFNNLYLPYLHRAGFVAPALAASDGLESPGGYVMDSIPGLYRHILVLDFKSLYPSIIRTFLIDPKGLIEGEALADELCAAGFLGARFSRNAPILPKLIGTLAAQREKAKADKNAPLSQAIKIIMNSLYGVLGSRGCVFHDARLASSITLRGHEIMKQTRAWIEAMGYRVIYGDTDSTFVWLGEAPQVADIDALGRELADKITRLWQQRLKETFALESFLELEFECHYEQFFMPTLRGSDEGSKKRYVGASRNAAGELALVFKGMEQVRSDWSPLARRVQFDLYQRMFNRLDIVDYLKSVIEELHQGKLDAELVFSKRLRRNIEDYTAKSSPHVKAAQLLCTHTQDPGFGRRGAQIDYLITLNGPEPSRFRQSPIDYQYYLDKQIKPIAEPVFTIMKESYSSIASNQLMLI
ncbi:DNA polymerase II [Shewanella salipaludis]|uniref:DNA polymerase n=1 Tax=Shewanella salipaludis TaxID=2723052 RepID=A0A972FW94_9GAMM|nr:DNA polymerase II [Shewanella salipaludis]NMH64423.1 DNA polymerase II [Shewanella salipaludis]